ncbi:MAG: Rrf2 family transcriptional regulator [Caldimonas sp.]
MKLTAYTDYSLRVLMYLAAQPGRRATIAEICTAFGIKENHLSKVVHDLAKKRWIDTARGKGGGMSLAVPAEEIRVGDVVRHAEGDAVPAECFSPGPSNCPIVVCCQLRGALASAVDAFYEVLDAYTVADITRNRKALWSVLQVSRPKRRGGVPAGRGTSRS